MNVFNNRIKRSVVYSTSTISIYGVIGWTTSLCRWSILIFVWYVCVCVRQRPNKFLCRHIFFPPHHVHIIIRIGRLPEPEASLILSCT